MDILLEEVKMRTEGIRDAIKRGRPAFLAASIASALVILAFWNAHAYSLFQVASGVNQTQPGTLHEAESKALEVALSFSQTLAGWAFLIIAGSVLILVGTEYHRPDRTWVRASYFAFVPGWIELARSVYSGIQAHGVYVGYLLSKHPDFLDSRTKMNDFAYDQRQQFEIGLVFFGIWLILYLVWWVCLAGPQCKKGGQSPCGEPLSRCP